MDRAGNKTETISEAITIQSVGETAEDIVQNPTKYYAGEVDYKPKNGANVKWKIFYADTEHIYLIADDYISSTYAPKGKGGTSITANSTYKLSFGSVISDYSGSSNITNSLVKPWLSYLNSSYGRNSTYTNMKAVAYMLDTNVWSTYTDSEGKAEYAIGGPTLDLFSASYNQKYPNKQIQYQADSTGYQVKWSTDGSYSYSISGLPTNDSLYVISSTRKAQGMWLASPSASNGDYVMYVSYDGYVYYSSYNNNYPGLRPLVCLKSDVRLLQQSDGTYKII